MPKLTLFQAWIILVLALGPACICTAEDGFLPLSVVDPKNKAIEHVVLSPAGAGNPSLPTDHFGRTRIKLAPQTKPFAPIKLQLPADSDLVFISPWDYIVFVPSFDNNAQTALVVLARRGARDILTSDQALRASAAPALPPARSPRTIAPQRRTEMLG